MEADGKGVGWTGGLLLPAWGTALVSRLALLSALVLAAFALAAPSAGERQTLRFGGDANYPPYHFLGPEGRPDGFDVALAREVSHDLGLEPVFELGDWGIAMERLARGEVDVVPMFWSLAREQRFLFSEPVLLRHHALFGYFETPTLPSLDHLANARVAVQRSGLASEALRELGRPRQRRRRRQAERLWAVASPADRQRLHRRGNPAAHTRVQRPAARASAGG